MASALAEPAADGLADEAIPDEAVAKTLAVGAAEPEWDSVRRDDDLPDARPKNSE